MRERLLGLVEKAELAIGACAGVVSEEDLGRLAGIVSNVRVRLAHPDEVVVVALVGGTGSGKSSLLNAIVGSDVALVGGTRPTTGSPLAVTSAVRRGVIAPYLDEIGVGDRVVANLPDWLCLIDMPDTDSVEVDHRLRVEALLPGVDMMIWVVDPEKYRDAALHHTYIRPLSGYSSQFVFVLNQVDRLDSESAERVRADFEEALAEDGVGEPVVISAAAAPVSGPPTGIPEVLAALGGAVDDDAVQVKLLADLRRCAADLVAATGGGGLDFERRSSEVLTVIAGQLMDSDVTGAVITLTGFLDSLADRVGGLSAAEIRGVATIVPVRVQEAAEALARLAAIRRGRRSRPRPQPGEAESPITVLATAVIEPTRDILTRRAHAGAAIADLVLSLQAVFG